MTKIEKILIFNWNWHEFCSLHLKSVHQSTKKGSKQLIWPIIMRKGFWLSLHLVYNIKDIFNALIWVNADASEILNSSAVDFLDEVASEADKDKFACTTIVCLGDQVKVKSKRNRYLSLVWAHWQGIETRGIHKSLYKSSKWLYVPGANWYYCKCYLRTN